MRRSIHNYNKRTVYRLILMKHSPHAIRIKLTAGTLAKFAFFATLVTMPLRMRMVLLARPNGTLYGDYIDFLLFVPDITLIVTLFAWGLVKWMDRGRSRAHPKKKRLR